LLDEVEEWSGRALRLRRKLNQVKPAYQDLLAELSVELDWLKMKAEAAADAIDEYHEILSEDD
jgi:hypothetical protein